MNKYDTLPIDLGIVLAENTAAYSQFARLSSKHRQALIERSRDYDTKPKMKEFVQQVVSASGANLRRDSAR
jgi:hypothetical protein